MPKEMANCRIFSFKTNGMKPLQENFILGAIFLKKPDISPWKEEEED